MGGTLVQDRFVARTCMERNFCERWLYIHVLLVVCIASSQEWPEDEAELYMPAPETRIHGMPNATVRYVVKHLKCIMVL